MKCGVVITQAGQARLLWAVGPRPPTCHTQALGMKSSWVLSRASPHPLLFRTGQGAGWQRADSSKLTLPMAKWQDRQRTGVWVQPWYWMYAGRSLHPTKPQLPQPEKRGCPPRLGRRTEMVGMKVPHQLALVEHSGKGGGLPQ